MNMRPELFRAAILRVPFVDVVTAILDPSLPLTVHEYDEWGNPEDPGVLDYIRSYDPYLNIKKGVQYPAIYCTGSQCANEIDI